MLTLKSHMSTHIDIKKSHAKVINMHAQKIKFQMNITILHKDNKC